MRIQKSCMLYSLLGKLPQAFKQFLLFVFIQVTMLYAVKDKIQYTVDREIFAVKIFDGRMGGEN